MATTRVRRVHIHLQDMELATQLAAQQVTGNVAAGAVHNPQLAPLKAVLQRRQIQAVAGKYRMGFVILQQFAGTLFNCRQHAELVGMRNTWLRTS